MLKLPYEFSFSKMQFEISNRNLYSGPISSDWNRFWWFTDFNPFHWNSHMHSSYPLVRTHSIYVWSRTRFVKLSRKSNAVIAGGGMRERESDGDRELAIRTFKKINDIRNEFKSTKFPENKQRLHAYNTENPFESILYFIFLFNWTFNIVHPGCKCSKLFMKRKWEKR